MGAITEYRRPGAAYRAEAAASPWRRLGGWRRNADGSWGAVYAKRARRPTRARRATVFLRAGAWVWRVEEFDLSTRAVRRTVNRSPAGRWYVAAAAAMPWADAAARTSD